MDLFDLLACPVCCSPLSRGERLLRCVRCAHDYPVIGQVPILLPPGHAAATANENELHVRTGYDPWLHRVVLQSLPPSAIALEIGAGSMALNVPNIVRLDVALTPYVDVVADSHTMPFLPGVFDFVFSLAVMEHLRDPHAAAEEMHRVLKPGGYVYGECSFVFPYHGYPHHYFNATHQGLAEVFHSFTALRRGVAPYQMPSFAVRGVLEAWSNDLGDDPAATLLQELVRQLLAQPLTALDARLSPQAALRCAAGTYFLGVKTDAGASQVVPEVLRAAIDEDPRLRAAFAEPLDLGNPSNALRWAQDEGRRCQPTLETYFAAQQPFRKNASCSDRTADLLGLGPSFDQVVSDAGMEGWLDGIVGEGEQGGELQVGGWAADTTRGAPVARVEVWLDGAPCTSATIGGERADVVQVSGRRNYRLSGWTAMVPLHGLPPGTHRLSAFAYGVYGSRAKLNGERIIEIRPRG